MRGWKILIIESENNDLYISTLITIVHLYLQNSANCWTVVIKLIFKLFQMKKSFASYYKSLAAEKEKKKYWCCWRIGKNRMHIFNLNENLILGCQVWKWNPATNQTHINPKSHDEVFSIKILVPLPACYWYHHHHTAGGDSPWKWRNTKNSFISPAVCMQADSNKVKFSPFYRASVPEGY